MDPTNRNTALASAFAEELARCGLRRAVISPGSRSTPLALALWRQPQIEVTAIVDERSAAFFAVGAAQACGAPVAILCTSGTAAANYHPAVCEADRSAIPLLVLTADRPPELREVGAAMRKMLKEGGPPPRGKWGDLAVLEPVRDYKARHASTMLTFDAVTSALDQIEGKAKQAAE